MSTFPRWLRWAIPPLLLPPAAIAWIANHWDRIPQRYATHFGPGGHPDGWTVRTPRHVYGPLVFAEGLGLLLLALMLCTWYGSRRSNMDSPMEKIMLGVIYLMTAVFTWVGMAPVAQLPVWPLIVVLPLVTIGMLVYVGRVLAQPDNDASFTPPECWTFGGIYYNPQDLALFVPARIGLGYTLNMANRSAYLFLTLLLMGFGGLIVFLFWSQR